MSGPHLDRALLKALAVLALVSSSGAALADPPALVGRVTVANGPVSVAGGGAEEAGGNLVNWPISNDSHVTTASGASAELRVGSATVRLDGDSELDVVELDDDSFRLRLNYGSVSVRIRNPDMLRGFELVTAQVRVTLPLPGKVRVDTERVADTSVVGVSEGEAQVGGTGTGLTVRAGRRAELHDDDVRTGALQLDAFDNWPETPDVAGTALRYVGDDVTGYEQLDQNGSWSVDDDYGPVWQPSAVPADWIPYRDGRWVWVAPWGWTWVDDLPWAYAPSHYGRWFLRNRHWCWAPGVARGRPVWAPALVGWVGGDQWQAGFGAGGPQPAVGWYPLTPRARFVPAYRVSAVYEQRINAAHDARWGARADETARVERRDGLTVLPHAQFTGHTTLAVMQAPRAVVTASQWRAAPTAVAPAPIVRPPAYERPVEPRRGGAYDVRQATPAPTLAPRQPPSQQAQQMQQMQQAQQQQLRPLQHVPPMPQGVPRPASPPQTAPRPQPEAKEVHREAGRDVHGEERKP
jgi:hypothetical protein